jgi:hypothetical protein
MHPWRARGFVLSAPALLHARLSSFFLQYIEMQQTHRNSCGAHTSNFSLDLRAELNFHRDYYITIQASAAERNWRQNILASGAWLIAEKPKEKLAEFSSSRVYGCASIRVCSIRRDKKMSFAVVTSLIFCSVFFNLRCEFHIIVIWHCINCRLVLSEPVRGKCTSSKSGETERDSARMHTI